MTSLGCLHPYLPWPAPLVLAPGWASFFLSYSHILASQAHGADDITYHRHLLSTRHRMGGPIRGVMPDGMAGRDEGAHLPASFQLRGPLGIIKKGKLAWGQGHEC